jgi:Dirigent-like protein
MTLSAPPKPPVIADPPAADPLEALVEEARRRARRRRQGYLGATLFVLLAGLAAYVGFARGDENTVSDVGHGAPLTGSARDVHATGLSFRLLSTPTSFRQVEHWPEGAKNEGDRLYVKSELRNGWGRQFGHPQDAVVGRDSWVWTTLATPGWSLVIATVELPGGTLRLRGRVHSTQSLRVVPVVGGTGRFANARGTCKVQERSSLPSLNDYKLRLTSSLGSRGGSGT